MDLITEIRTSMALADPGTRDKKIAAIGDVFEYSRSLDKAEVIQAVQLLRDYGLLEEDRVVKESIFHAISLAIICQGIGKLISWEPVAAELPHLHAIHLEYALFFLGASGNEHYLPTLERYATDSNPRIKRSALNGIARLRESAKGS